MPKEFPAASAGFNPFAEMIGLDFIEYGGGKSKCKLAVADRLMNPHGVLHGAVIYAMADTGMGGALYSLLDKHETCATIEIKIHYFKSVSSGNLICETWVVNRARHVAVLESEVRDDARLIAKATGTYYIFPVRYFQT